MAKLLHTRRSAFTLIELLVVIAIIMILAGMIMVGVNAGQESAKVADCKNSLLQIHRLMLTYASRYNGFLPTFWHERWVGELGLVGVPWGKKQDDLRVPMVWNNIYPNPYADNYRIDRTGAGVLTCKNDLSGFICDQGCPCSYLGLAKYGWWHRADPGTGPGVFMRKQIHEVENASKGILLCETEPFHYTYGGCGCRLHVYRHPKFILKRHFKGGNILFFDGHLDLIKDPRKMDIEYWEPGYTTVNVGDW
jgi:prepilin-type N-terminal cleavage/methylation domain-containing protein/prepilin-type processing-associated H-X9-DG protein